MISQANIKSSLIALLITCGLIVVTPALYASDDPARDVSKYHKIIDEINQADIPEETKDKLFTDVKATMIETIRKSNASEETKKQLIQDIGQVKR